MQEVVHPPVSLKMASRRKICCRHHWINNCCSMFHGSSVAISWCPGSQQPRRLETAEARITGSSSEEVLVIFCRIISRWCHHSDCRLNDLSWYKSKTVSCNCSVPFAKAKSHIIIIDYKKMLFLIAMQEKQTVPNDICSVASTSALSPPLLPISWVVTTKVSHLSNPGKLEDVNSKTSRNLCFRQIIYSWCRNIT